MKHIKLFESFVNDKEISTWEKEFGKLPIPKKIKDISKEMAKAGFIRKDTKSEKAKFWRGNKLTELGEYNKGYLPKDSFKKLKQFIEKDNWSLGLKTKILEYEFISDKNPKYTYCIVEI